MIGKGATLAAIAGCAFALRMTTAEATGVTETVVYSFCSQGNCIDGATPLAGLIDLNGTLYGTTYAGGEYRLGTAFALDPATGAEMVLHSFGSTAGDGWNPMAGLRTVNGSLYGTTYSGGATGGGTIFSLDPGTGAETVVHSFTAYGDGLAPAAGLSGGKGEMGNLFGTTSEGGTGSLGAVFKFDANTGTETVVHSFGYDADGSAPQAGLTRRNGELYGTTSKGGVNGWGTVFKLDPKGAYESVLWSFGSGTDGQIPVARLIEVGGMLYGTTSFGGTYDYGTVFILNPDTGAESVLYNFNSADGTEPVTSLISRKGVLYGTTSGGGEMGEGALFSLDPKTGAYTVLYSFGSNQYDGAHPYGDLIDVNGTLYGTTYYGGVYGEGTVFAIALP